MAALTATRAKTHQRSADTRAFGSKAGAKYFQGGMAAVDATDHAVPMATSTTLRGVGRIETSYDNTAGADDAAQIVVGCAGAFQFGNSAAGDLITKADIGLDCYGVDDQTVARTNGGATRSVAGKIFDVDAQGVWVKFS